MNIPQKDVKIAKFISQYRFDSVVIVTKTNSLKYFVCKSETEKLTNGETVQNFNWIMTKEKSYKNDTILDVIMPCNVSSTMIEFIKSKRYTGSSFILISEQ